MALTPMVQLAGVWVGIDHRFAVHVFEGHVSLADMDQLQAFGDRWVKANSGKRVELVIIHPSSARMTSEERSRIASLIKRWEPDRVASATVILASGIQGAMQRSVLTGLQLLAPPAHPVKVFGEIAPAVTWLLPHIQAVNVGAAGARLQQSVCKLCDDFLRRAG